MTKKIEKYIRNQEAAPKSPKVVERKDAQESGITEGILETRRDFEQIKVMPRQKFEELITHERYNVRLLTFFSGTHPNNWGEAADEFKRQEPELESILSKEIGMNKKGSLLDPDHTFLERLYLAYETFRGIGLSDKELLSPLGLHEEHKLHLKEELQALTNISDEALERLTDEDQKRLYAVLTFLTNKRYSIPELAQFGMTSVGNLSKVAGVLHAYYSSTKRLLAMSFGIEDPIYNTQPIEMHDEIVVIKNQAGEDCEFLLKVTYDELHNNYSLTIK